MNEYKEWFLSLPQEEKVTLMNKYTHIHDVENMNEIMAKRIFNAENEDILCPHCFKRTIIDCDDKTCLNYNPK